MWHRPFPLVAAVLFVLSMGACSGSTPVAAPQAEPSAVAVTPSPAPTLVPVPTAPPDPTPAPSATSTPALPVPRFEVGGPRLGAFVDTTFAGDLPDALQDEVDAARSAGAAILNAQADPTDEETVAMHWVVRPDEGDFLVTRLVDRVEDGTPVWRVESAWHLVVASDMVVTFGTVVCAAPSDSFDWRQGEFIAVTNEAQDVAFGAWTMTIDGPTPYADTAGLDCERFTP